MSIWTYRKTSRHKNSFSFGIEWRKIHQPQRCLLEWRPRWNCRINSFDGFIWHSIRAKKLNCSVGANIRSTLCLIIDALLAGAKIIMIRYQLLLSLFTIPNLLHYYKIPLWTLNKYICISGGALLPQKFHLPNFPPDPRSIGQTWITAMTSFSSFFLLERHQHSLQ